MAKKIENNKSNGEKVSLFARFSHTVSTYTGRPIVFVLACATVVVWGATGPIFKYSDTWQLVINTGTTIVTFLMVFLIQNTQNRDTRALHLKLDELIVSLRETSDEFMDIEDMDEKQMQKMHDKLIEKSNKTGVALDHGEAGETEGEVKTSPKSKKAK
ncbi:MAG: low affinity iron permease family protein [Acidobacteriota bacterium]